jgi:hypothetical protein
LCGSGPTCDASQGLECRNGTCACAADPGFKLGKFSCDFDPSIGAYRRIVEQCSVDYANICHKTDPSLPAELPEWACSSSTCNPGYSPVTPICTSPA